MLTHPGLIGAAGTVVASGGNAFSDDFTNLNNFTLDNTDATMTIVGGQLNVTGSYSEGVARYSTTNTGTVTQYARFQWISRTSAASGLGVVLRSGTSGYKYIISLNGVSPIIEWYRETFDLVTYTLIATTSMSAINANDYYSFTIQGVGVNTIVKMWVNTANATPYNKDNWDSSNDPADYTLTDAGGLLITNKADTGLYVGVYSYIQSGSCRIDNFSGGGL